MYAILISVAAAAAVLFGWSTLLFPGHWGWGTFFAIVTFIGVGIWLARRLGRQLKPTLEKAQNQAQRGALDQAIESFESLLPLGNWLPGLRGQMYAQIGALSYANRDEKKAVAMLQKSSRRSSDGQMLLASIYYRDGRKEEADRTLLKAIKANKKNVMLYHLLAWLRNKSDDRDGAMAALDLHLRKDKDNAITKDQLLRLQNGKRMNMGQFGNNWYVLGFESPQMGGMMPQMPGKGGFDVPPQSRGMMQQGRKGFRTPPKDPSKQKKKKGKKKRR
jgi:tetratricopeptide (TPR) repeat protein